MDYRYLKAFLLTAHHHSFSKAAKELNIAQSAVSRQIKLLEESVKEELIIRSSKKVLLTYKGKELYNATKTFDKNTHALFNETENQEVSIGVLHGLLENWFGKIIIKFYENFDRNLNIHVDTPENLKELLSSGKLDIILTIENVQSDIISSLKLFNENLTIISRDKIDLEKLHDYRWIVYHVGDNLYKSSDKISEKIITVDSITTIINLVKNGLGIALVPDHILEGCSDLQTYRPKDIPKSEIYMASLNYHSLPAHLSEIMELIKQSIPK